ncbi:MAG: aldolase/citrate lyase family protein [Lentisphaeria bacterium]|nr:aldolase/citrate lyase family protein [Lentisphaeria bacterium]
MNVLEKEMIGILKILRDECGCFQIKAEFEAEGTRMSELMRLKDVVSQVDLPIIMKIGGVESVTDVYNSLQIGVASIIAPMVETPYALKKYAGMIENMIAPDNAADIDFYFNMETITGYENFAAMMSMPELKFIDGVTIGRVDLAGSMDKDRSEVDSEEFFDICAATFQMAREKGLACGLGGAISTRSAEFIRRLTSAGLIDKFETRKIVFRADAVDRGEKIFRAALEFELLWLKSKRRYYSGIRKEDENRIAMLEKRLNS